MNYLSIEQARSRIEAYIVHTPLLRAQALERAWALDCELWLKCENLQRTGSYKLRGALNCLLDLDSKKRRQGVVCRSAGNFGAALALAGHLTGVSVTIVMSTSAPQVKVDQTRQWGATVELVEGGHPETQARAEALAFEQGLILVSPYNVESVSAGQGTCAVECAEQLGTFDVFLAPVGGGGLMAGCAVALATCLPNCKVVGAEPELAGDFALSLSRGERVAVATTDTIADGLRAPSVGDFTWPVLREYVRDCLTVSEQSIKETMKALREFEGLIVEPSGAVSVAAVRRGTFPKKRVVAVVSGRNVDWRSYVEWTR